MYNEFCYNIQVRYALGYRQLGEGYFDLRTLYYFRERLARHLQEKGENLLEQAFEQVTDEQLQAFCLKRGKQRMDSTLLASNIRQMGRVQLLVTVMQRVWRMLSEADRQRYGELFAPYLQGHAGQYVYRLKKAELPEHLQRIGEAMGRLLTELEAAYGEQPTYHVLARVFAEHFRLEPEGLQVKEGSEGCGTFNGGPFTNSFTWQNSSQPASLPTFESDEASSLFTNDSPAVEVFYTP